MAVRLQNQKTKESPRMPRRNSTTRHRRGKLGLPAAEVNVVSLMDILTTLLFFLLLVSSINEFSIVRATSLPPAVGDASEPKPTFALQVTVTGPNSANVFLGAIEKLSAINAKQLEKYLISSGYTGNAKAGFLRKLKLRQANLLLPKIQKDLIEIKKSFPHEGKAVISFGGRVQYQQIIDSITAVRTLGEKQQAYELTDISGGKQSTKVLFPQVLISEYDKDA